ncbi:integrase, catalytic region, zinc finger, CCHC-type containing protein [Tanacetum coccineum]
MLNKVTPPDTYSVQDPSGGVTQAAILKEVVEQGKSQNPLNNCLDYACRPNCSLIGNVTISRIYYVEGLGHNLFSVGQFCDSNLEVAFRQHTCFIHNLEGDDLLIGSRGNNLYTLSIRDMMASSPICLLSKASKTKSWLWHRRLSHLNFGAINHLARHGLVREENHDLDVAHMNNDPFFGIPIPKNDSEASSSLDVVPTIVHTTAPNSEHVTKWTKDHPIDNIIGELGRPVSTRLQLHEKALFYYYEGFPPQSFEPKT